MSRILHALFSVCLTAAVVAAGLIAVPASQSAEASNASPAGLPATVTQDALPTVQVNGVVWTQVIVGNTVYAGGKFTSARPAGSPAGTNETARSSLLAYNLTTGALITGFAPTLNGQVKSIAASPDGSRVYIGGDFTTVNGVTQNRIAALDSTTGALISSFVVSASGMVNAIVATQSTVYFGGVFATVNNKARARLASVAAATGAITTWAPTGVSTGVQAMVLSPDGTRVIVGGQFSVLNGTAANAIGALDATTGATLPFAFSTVTTNGSNSSSGVYSLTTDGTSIFVGAWGYTSGNFEGTASLNPTTGAVNWLNDCWGDNYSGAVLNGVLYASSHAHDCTGAGYFSDTGDKHYGLAWSTTASGRNNVVDGRGWNYSAYSTSNLLQWNPNFKIGTFTGQNQSTWSVAASGNYVVMGGEFPSVNGTPQQGLVRFTTHAAAPNAYGPTKANNLYPAQSTVNGTPVVTINAVGSTDPDDGYVTYSLIRDGATTPVATSTVPTSGFWESSAVSLSDTTAPLGSTHKYQIKAVTAGTATSLSAAVSVTVTGVAAPDVALKTPASQSSEILSASAGRAVDGNTDGNFSNGSVTHTNADANSWWKTDLQATVANPDIRIWNRTDCCTARLADYWVFFSSTPFDTTLTPTQQAAQAGVWSTHITTAPNPVSTVTVPSGTSGRYVMVQENTANQNLSLAEVQVYGVTTPIVTPPAPTGPDLALNTTALQSSDAFGGTAARAVDGNTDGTFSNGSVTHTNADANSWWKTDLKATVSNAQIRIWNRTDCCSDRLSDYWVFFSSTPFDTTLTPTQQAAKTGVWSTHLTAAPAPSTTVTVPSGTSGQYVLVQENTANQNLSLAEVQVYGTATPIVSADLALNKTASQSSDAAGTTAARAVDGNTDGVFANGSVTHTDLDLASWWQVDLGAASSIGSIGVWNRTDCCTARLSDYWVFASSTPFDTTLTPTQQAAKAGVWSTHLTAAPSPSTTVTVPSGTSGRYVMVQQGAANQYLSLAEVQVFAP